jgi:16S rRNA processing protein RimM
LLKSEAPPPPSKALLDWPQDAVEVARIMEAWGLQGALKVTPFSSSADAILSATYWYVQIPFIAAGISSTPRSSNAERFTPSRLSVRRIKPHKDQLIVEFVEVPDRTAAEALRGAKVFISRSLFPPTRNDEYYWVDLIGLSVYNRQSHSLGQVIGLMETGPSSVLRIAQQGGAETDECLIPFVPVYVDKVDLAARRIDVDWELDD